MIRKRTVFTTPWKVTGILLALTWTVAGPAVATELQNGVGVTLDGSPGEELRFTIEVPPGAQNLDIDLEDPTIGAGLFVRLGSPPTSTYSGFCSSSPREAPGGTTCSWNEPDPGTYHILVYGFAAFSNAQLDARFWECEGGCEGGGELNTDDRRSGLSASHHGEIHFYLRSEFFGPPLGALEFSLSGGTGDADLYIKQGVSPTRLDYDCVSRLPGNEEGCSVDAATGIVYLMIYAYEAFSGVTLEVRGGGDTSGCTANDTTLCIDDQPGDGRFEITLRYDSVVGNLGQGDAKATSLASLGIRDGGIFSFNNPSNPELLVKVIKGCPLTDHFWVFYAATTTVGFELSVKDTRWGVTRRYYNSDQHPADPVMDTFAFDTCP